MLPLTALVRCQLAHPCCLPSGCCPAPAACSPQTARSISRLVLTDPICRVRAPPPYAVLDFQNPPMCPLQAGRCAAAAGFHRQPAAVPGGIINGRLAGAARRAAAAAPGAGGCWGMGGWVLRLGGRGQYVGAGWVDLTAAGACAHGGAEVKGICLCMPGWVPGRLAGYVWDWQVRFGTGRQALGICRQTPQPLLSHTGPAAAGARSRHLARSQPLP